MLYERVVGAAVVLALGAVLVRRMAWVRQWERAATINLAARAVCVFLILPATAFLFRPLGDMLGLYHLENLAGQMVSLVGLAVLTYATINRLEPGQERFLRLRIGLPAMIVLPMLPALFILGAPRDYMPELMDVTDRPWLAAYGVLLATTAAWLLGHFVWALIRTIRLDPQARPVAWLYLVAAGIDIATIASRLVTAFSDDWPLTWTWAGIAGALCLYALAGVEGVRRKRQQDRPTAS